MENQFTRTEMLFGTATLEKLSQSHVMVFGMGGVDSYVVEVLVCSGVGGISLINNSEVSLPNINRQLVTSYSALGQEEAKVARRCTSGINPHYEVRVHALLYLPEAAHEIDLSACDYVIDCIDAMAVKLETIKQYDVLHIPVIAYMGVANKIGATRFKVAGISKTQVDPPARVTKKKLRELGITHLKMACSDEQPQKPLPIAPTREASSAPESALSVPIVTNKEWSVPISNTFIPATAGLIIGGEMVEDSYDLQLGVKSQRE